MHRRVELGAGGRQARGAGRGAPLLSSSDSTRSPAAVRHAARQLAQSSAALSRASALAHLSPALSSHAPCAVRLLGANDAPRRPLRTRPGPGALALRGRRRRDRRDAMGVRRRVPARDAASLCLRRRLGRRPDARRYVGRQGCSWMATDDESTQPRAGIPSTTRTRRRWRCSARTRARPGTRRQARPRRSTQFALAWQ